MWLVLILAFISTIIWSFVNGTVWWHSWTSVNGEPPHGRFEFILIMLLSSMGSILTMLTSIIIIAMTQ